jgi:hypothetical protein
MNYINSKIEELDTEKKLLQQEILSLTHQPNISPLNVISNHVEKWDETSLADKKAVVDALIKVITIADGVIDITWNI